MVVSGYTQDNIGASPWNALLVRVNAHGKPDPKFGTDGVVVTNWGADDRANSVVIQSDGKIVIAGRSNRIRAMDFMIARFRDNGELDPTFGDQGCVITSFGPYSISEAKGVAIQHDGRIVVAGYAYLLDLKPKPPNLPCFALARYFANGHLDKSFGHNGLVTTTFSSSRWANAAGVVIHPDGRVIAGGMADMGATSHDYRFAMACYRPSNGSLDPTFGSGGKVTIKMGNHGGNAFSIATAASGKIALAGGAANETATGQMAVAMCEPDGSLDPAFGAGGRAYAPFLGYPSHANSVVLLEDGTVLAAGQACFSSLAFYRQAVAEFRRDGSHVPWAMGGVTPIGAWGPANGIAYDGKRAITVGWADDGTFILQALTIAAYA
jgi:uncharacterized delta-60 repeat protein